MKIAYVCQSFPPMVSGAALVIQRLAKGIADRGHSVMVLTSSDLGMAYTEEIGEIKIIRMVSYRNPLRVDQSFVLWSHDEIFQSLVQFQPDILHTHDPLNLGVSAIRAAQRMSTLSVVTIHQLPWFITTYMPLPIQVKIVIEKSIWQYSKWFFKQCDALITPSKMIADIIWEHTCFLPQVISNGVDLDLFSPIATYPHESRELCKKYHLCPDKPVILYVGRIDPDKNVDLVVQAASKVMKAVEAQLLIVGDGTQKDELIQLSKSLDIYQNCCFPGFISKYGDLPGIYRLASVFVTASEIEIQSSVVMEAASSGLPVITVNASSMPEFVLDQESGYLLPPGDIKKLADRMVSLIKNPSKAKKMGLAARRVAELHSNRRFIQEHEQLYDSAVQFHRTRFTEKILV